ncbi:hypothetical protein [Chryseobacterium indologenes]|uniref:hypothetical protein n=1 Tax=Chryseobacterium indologenes TaxID=253 RepID=UPI003D32D862
MLDYQKLRKEFKAIMSEFDGHKLDAWIKFDENRLREEEFFRGLPVTVIIEKPAKITFKNVDTNITVSDTCFEDDISLAA